MTGHCHGPIRMGRSPYTWLKVGAYDSKWAFMVHGEHSWFKVDILSSGGHSQLQLVSHDSRCGHPCSRLHFHITDWLLAKGLLPDAGVFQDPLCPFPNSWEPASRLPPLLLSLRAGWQETRCGGIPHLAPWLEFSPVSLGPGFPHPTAVTIQTSLGET